MTIKRTMTVVAIFIMGIIAGCAADRWVTVEPGEYSVVNRSGTANKIALSEIRKMEIDREKNLVAFTMVDDSEIVASFMPRDRAAWPSGCPSNINATRMEVLDLEEIQLTLGSATFNNPVLVRDCPPEPMQVVLREDGPIGGGGACAHPDQCIFFEK